MGEARQRLVAQVEAVVASLARGEEPNNEVGHWIVAHGGDVVSALKMLVESRRAADVVRGRASSRGRH